MKKFLKKSALLLLVLLLALSLIACEAQQNEGVDNDDDNGAAQNGDGTKSEGKISFSVTHNGTVIELGKPAASVLAALGTPNATQEVFDCGEGNSRMYYQYASLDLYTMKSGGQEVIDQIELWDDLTETAAKISIGSEESAVRAAYGTPTSEKDGKLTYSSGSNHLIIEIKNGKVSAIGLLRKTN